MRQEGTHCSSCSQRLLAQANLLLSASSSSSVLTLHCLLTRECLHQLLRYIPLLHFSPASLSYISPALSPSLSDPCNDIGPLFSGGKLLFQRTQQVTGHPYPSIKLYYASIRFLSSPLLSCACNFGNCISILSHLVFCKLQKYKRTTNGMQSFHSSRLFTRRTTKPPSITLCNCTSRSLGTFSFNCMCKSLVLPSKWWKETVAPK